jgi:hypothetical protein
VPHERAEIVRGFLTEFYTLRALDRPPDKPGADRPNLADNRRIPGRLPLSRAQAEEVKEQIARGEEQAIQHMQSQFQRAGGCRYCHAVSEPPGAGWQIVPPNIPDRWLQHSRFRHDRHRMLACMSCHANLRDGTSVLESRSTGDVLLPSLAVCRTCHSSIRSANTAGTPIAPSGGARTDCVECHIYHARSNESLHSRAAAGWLPQQ